VLASPSPWKPQASRWWMSKDRSPATCIAAASPTPGTPRVPRGVGLRDGKCAKERRRLRGEERGLESRPPFCGEDSRPSHHLCQSVSDGIRRALVACAVS
jgi:hypothetical protein